jgi:DNA polymerase III delta prime subunit
MSDQFLWVERYRPQTINECILQEGIKQTFKDYISSGELPNFLFYGTAGVGKTTVARALCNEIGADCMFINGSDESGIDVLRSKIRGFASSVSLTDAKKVVILDEADYLNPQSTQPALRGFIEEFADNCRFILTCNFKNRIIEPLHSRCSVIDFRVSGKDKIELAGQFFKRVMSILNQEGIDFDKKVVAELVQKHFPDFRRVINEMQRYSVSGKIDSGILVNVSSDSFKQLYTLMKDKNFSEVRKWASANSDGDTVRIFRELYDHSNIFLEPTSVPQLVLVLADYQFKASFVADHELNLMACLTEIMGGCKFL